MTQNSSSLVATLAPQTMSRRGNQGFKSTAAASSLAILELASFTVLISHSWYSLYMHKQEKGNIGMERGGFGAKDKGGGKHGSLRSDGRGKLKGRQQCSGEKKVWGKCFSNDSRGAATSIQGRLLKTFFHPLPHYLPLGGVVRSVFGLRRKWGAPIRRFLIEKLGA